MRTFFSVIAALAFSSPLAAQDNDVANGSQVGNWVVACNAITVNRTSCRVRQTLSIAETGQIIVNLLAAPQGTDSAILVAQMPMGVFLPGGAVFRPLNSPDAEQTTMIWQRCSGEICEAAIELSAQDLAALTENGNVLFGYKTSRTDDPVIVEIDMTDLGAAIAAIRG